MHATQETPHDRLRVVLAEDDTDTRRMLEKGLAIGGYDVVALTDGFQLMSLIGAVGTDELVPPDFIVADVRMPHFTGLEALYAVHRTTLWAPVILISAFCDDATKCLARHGGAVALLQKPLDPERLLATLAAVRSFRLHWEDSAMNTAIETTQELAKLRVVLVEDDADVRQMLQKALELEGYEVVALEDGLQLMCLVDAVAREELVPPDFIVTDIRMPHFSGLDVLVAVERISVSTPVILISAYCDQETRRLAESGGAAALLAKPLDPKRLLMTLDRIRSLDPGTRQRYKRTQPSP